MDFTALHRLLGRPPGPLTDEMLDAAVSSRLAETDDLDWKRQLPEERNLAQSDLVKDIAAMANSGGGLIVFGVDEDQKHARGRTDVGPVSESFERTLRRVAVSGIQPPVFNLLVHRLGPESNRALVVGVPPSVDAPHLIYRGEYFGAAVRNNADTEWLRERQLESLYRARLDERRNAGHALTQLYLEIAAGRDAEVRAWFIAVARPRVPTFTRRLTRDHARSILGNSGDFALSLDRGGRRPMLPVHPLQSVDVNNPRVGLRRWIAPNTAVGAGSQCYETWASIHDDGSATLAAAVGGGRTRDGHDPANRIDSQRLEACVAGVLASLAPHLASNQIKFSFKRRPARRR